MTSTWTTASKIGRTSSGIALVVRSTVWRRISPWSSQWWSWRATTWWRPRPDGLTRTATFGTSVRRALSSTSSTNISKLTWKNAARFLFATFVHTMQHLNRKGLIVPISDRDTIFCLLLRLTRKFCKICSGIWVKKLRRERH